MLHFLIERDICGMFRDFLNMVMVKNVDFCKLFAGDRIVL